jgi:hypothetical protein
MSTSNTQGNATSRAIGFIALALFIVLFITAIVLPMVFNSSGNLVVTIFTLLLSVVGLFFSCVQAFPSMKDHFKALQPSISGRSAVIPLLSVLLLLSFTLNAFLFLRQSPKPPPTPTAIPSTISSSSVPASTPSTLASSSPTSSTSSASPAVTSNPSSDTSFPSYLPGHGTLIVNDTMLNQNAGGYQWQESNDPYGSCSFAADGYHIKATNYYYGCIEGRDDLTNFVVEAQITPRKGSAGGFSFRSPDGSGGKGYLIDLGPSGYYSMNRAPNNVALRQDTLSPLIPQGHTSYQVDIDVSGNQFTLYVDKTKIDSVTDTTYSHGYIGFYVTGDDNTASTEVIFTNVKVWSLS